jgi:hypothetical protein
MLCFTIISFYAVHRECARHWCRQHGQPPLVLSTDAIELEDRVLGLAPALRSSCTLEEESFPRRFPIYILMETIENFDSVYGTHNERALHAIQGILHDLVCFLCLHFFPFCFIIYLDDIILQRHISIEVQDVVWVVGLERSLLLLRQIYHDEISFHSIILPAVNQGILALEILMALITNYQPSVVCRSSSCIGMYD